LHRALLERLERNELPIREALQQPTVWLVDVTGAWRPQAAWAVQFEDIPEEVLPAPGVTLVPQPEPRGALELAEAQPAPATSGPLRKVDVQLLVDLPGAAVAKLLGNQPHRPAGTRRALEVVLPARVLERVCLNHLVDPHEAVAWSEFLGAAMLERVRHWVRDPLADRALPAEVGAHIAQEVEAGLSSPRIFAYDRAVGNGPVSRTWEVITPSGLLGVVRLVGGHWELATVYFSSEALHQPASNRWRAVMKARALRYSRLVLAEGKPLRVYPNPDTCLVVAAPDGSSATLNNFAFVEPPQWGFLPSAVWEEIPPVWEAA
jgi:hypothetical protein